jgi:predicted Zn-dependent protease
MADLLSEDDARALVRETCSYAGQDECVVTVATSRSHNTRFADNRVTTNGSVETAVVTVSVSKGSRSGSVVLTDLETTALRRAVSDAAAIAELATPNPEFVAAPGPQTYPDIDAWDAATASIEPEALVLAVGRALEAARARTVVGSGLAMASATVRAFGTTRGDFCYDRRTAADFTMTARTTDGKGSGWATAGGHRWGALDAREVATGATLKASRSAGARLLGPGRYTVILEPAAVAEFLPMLGGALDARAVSEGRSRYSRADGATPVGQMVADARVTLRADPFDGRLPGLPWIGSVPGSVPSSGGAFFNFGAPDVRSVFFPTRRTPWIERGVLKGLVFDPYWAAEQRVRPTPGFGASLVFDGEDQSLEQLVASTERGLLVTRFFYVRMVNPRSREVTGLTRDGVFMIEQGKVAHAVNNLRWNESPGDVLQRVDGLTRSEAHDNVVVPALRARDFNFTSVSDAV